LRCLWRFCSQYSQVPRCSTTGKQEAESTAQQLPVTKTATASATTSETVPIEVAANPVRESQPQLSNDITTLPTTVKAKQANAELSFGLQTVTFPNVESWLNSESQTGQSSKYQPYQYFRPLLQSVQRADGSIDVIPNISCSKYDADFIANRSSRYAGTVAKLSAKYGVDQNLIMAVIAQESCFKYNATSPAGAQGLMQLMPDTADYLRIKDAYDPIQNIDGGIRYLLQLKKEFKSDELVLAAYNSGPGTVRKTGGVPDYPETNEYIRKVFSFRNSYHAAAETLERLTSQSPYL